MTSPTRLTVLPRDQGHKDPEKDPAKDPESFDLSRVVVRHVPPGSAVPTDVLELRRQVYGLETGFLADGDLASANDPAGTHICLYYDDGSGSGEALIAATHLVDAEASDFADHSQLPESALRQGFYSSRSIVATPYRSRKLFSLLLYLACREYRLRGRTLMYAYMQPGDTPGRSILRYSFIEGVAPRSVRGRNGGNYEVVAAWGDLTYCMHRAFVSMSPELQAYVASQGLLADEIERTVRARIQQFYKGPWFTRLYAGTLTREQYVATLSNMHQFVRFTTRILGKLVGMTTDARLRRHYIEHLEGEVDHEVMLENDLRHLGADVDYVVNAMAPAVPIQEFMAVQESLSGFHQDPVGFLAVPFTIEGLSGHLPPDFGPALMRCIAGWGIKDPRRVTSFLTSHVHTDGGADGHWEMSRKMIRAFVTTEVQMQRFLNVIHLVMNGQDRAYAAYANLPVFSRTAADLELSDAASQPSRRAK